MVQFSHFDTRGYRTVDARTGYGEWAATYEGVVEDEMDIALLERLHTVDWSSLRVVADLACGTGRTAAWLRAKGITEIDGVDLTREMLARAEARGVHRRLVEADLRSTGLEGGAYDLVITSLVDEHVADLAPLYAEAARLARPGGTMVLVGYHPQFMMATGMPTYYNSRSGEPIAIETHLHLLSEHVTAGLEAGWQLTEMRERLVDDAWVALKPKWERFRHQPISFVIAWRKPA